MASVGKWDFFLDWGTHCGVVGRRGWMNRDKFNIRIKKQRESMDTISQGQGKGDREEWDETL